MKKTSKPPLKEKLRALAEWLDLKELRRLRWQNILLLVAAGCINAIGVNMFLAPVNLYDSGISGTSMLMAQITPASLSVFLIVLNVPLFLFGMRKQGMLFTVYSVWAVFIYSMASFVITDILPVDVAASSPFAGTDLLLCAVFGGLISGAGSGLTIRFGGAIDGIEVLAVIFAKRIGITVGTFVMIYNVILYILIGVFFGSWQLPLYSIITYAVAIKAVDFIVEGLDKAKSLMIITTKEEQVCQAISDEFGRGITQIEARGYYSGQRKCAIYFVVNRFQLPKLKTIIHEIDPYAFVTVTEISDVMGTSSKPE